ncbi:MAG: HEAT repeat domain-containing protein [Bdellovibrionales bacterium]|nr:HEAT repeat domain-containing protein [Bdellovibrionales bacterium]
MKKWIFTLVFLQAGQGYSAIKKDLLSQEQKNIYEALRLPRKNRLMTLKGKKQIFAKLHEIAVDEKQVLKLRWRAITTMGELSPLNAKPYLEKLFTSKHWFLRNAAMIAISHADRPTVMDWADKMLSDPSLMVRTSAVQAIKKIRGIELQDRLWEKINDKQNFHRGNSLWIRKHIADTLASFAIKGEEKKFVKLLLDRDQRLHPYALSALRKITGEKLATNKTLSERRAVWLKYFKDKL